MRVWRRIVYRFRFVYSVRTKAPSAEKGSTFDFGERMKSAEHLAEKRSQPRPSPIDGILIHSANERALRKTFHLCLSIIRFTRKIRAASLFNCIILVSFAKYCNFTLLFIQSALKFTMHFPRRNGQPIKRFAPFIVVRLRCSRK